MRLNQSLKQGNKRLSKAHKFTLMHYAVTTVHKACGPWNRGSYANFSNYDFDLNLNIFYGIDFTANSDYCRKLIVVARKNTNRPKPVLHVWINIESAFRIFLLLFKYHAYEDKKKKNYKTRPIFV